MCPDGRRADAGSCGGRAGCSMPAADELELPVEWLTRACQCGRPWAVGGADGTAFWSAELQQPRLSRRRAGGPSAVPSLGSWKGRSPSRRQVQPAGPRAGAGSRLEPPRPSRAAAGPPGQAGLCGAAGGASGPRREAQGARHAQTAMPTNPIPADACCYVRKPLDRPAAAQPTLPVAFSLTMPVAFSARPAAIYRKPERERRRM